MSPPTPARGRAAVTGLMLVLPDDTLSHSRQTPETAAAACARPL
ncbi:hypothetical protein ACQEU6_31215 [Spirillospora sp. CA-108201]